jgi:hypothetical protein
MDFISQIIDEVVDSVVEERWLPIDENYHVSDLGRVKSFAQCKDGRIMKPTISNNGYFVTRLGRKTQHLIHRLVLQTFLPIDVMKEVNHKNHIKTDNRLENLEWCSRSENERFKKKREGCSSQYKGVYWDKSRNKWEACCKIDGKSNYLGRFDDEHDAGRAYNEFIIKHDLQHFTILNDLSLLSL